MVNGRSFIVKDILNLFNIREIIDAKGVVPGPGL